MQGKSYPWPNSKEKSPTLDEVLTEFGGKTLVDIEIKAQAPKEEAVRIGGCC